MKIYAILPVITEGYMGFRFIYRLILCCSLLFCLASYLPAADSLYVNPNDFNDVTEYVRQRLLIRNYYLDVRALSDSINHTTRENLDSASFGWFEYEYFFNTIYYEFLYDVDGDGIKELLFLQKAGSFREPTFYICRHDRTMKKFQADKLFYYEFYPVIFKDHLFLVDDSSNTMRRDESYTIYRLTREFELEKISTLIPSYSYNIPDSLKQYVRYEFLDSLGNFDLKHLYGQSFFKVTKDSIWNRGSSSWHCYISFENGDSIIGSIFPTETGWHPSGMAVEVKLHDGRTSKFEGEFPGLSGFDIVEYKGQRYLIIAEGFTDTDISIISLNSLQVVHKTRLPVTVSISVQPVR
jgi:hypothetical protein